MAENRSEKSCYESRFGGGWISSAQFLSENMCNRKSRATGSGDLPPKFWEDSYWVKQFLLQVKHANELLGKFEMSDILCALRHPDAKKVYSFGLKSVLEPLIKRAQKLRLSQETQVATKSNQSEPTPSVDTTQKPRVPFGTKSKLQSLRDLDK